MKISIILINLIIILYFFTSITLAALKPGDNLRPFSLPTVDGRVIKVSMEDGQLKVQLSEASGKLISITRPEIILLDFWATWCLPCRAAMPLLEELYQKFQARKENKGRIEFFGLALDKLGAAVVKPFLQKIKLSYPQLCGSLEREDPSLIISVQKMASEYKVQEIPVVYLINREGKIVYAHVGFKEEYIKEIEKVISSLLRSS